VVPNNDRAGLEQILSGAFGRRIAFVEARAEGMTSGVPEESIGPTRDTSRTLACRLERFPTLPLSPADHFLD
jgi:hypothetical protein